MGGTLISLLHPHPPVQNGSVCVRRVFWLHFSPVVLSEDASSICSDVNVILHISGKNQIGEYWFRIGFV